MPTLSEIAAELGLSKSTVSRALRGVPGISAETIAEPVDAPIAQTVTEGKAAKRA